MKKSIIVLIVIAVIAIAIFGWVKGSYNAMVGAEESATTALANLQSTYQRRADLIPNLVEVVKGYAAHEKETLEGVVNARAKATQITLDPENMTPEKLQEFQKAQGELGSALGRLIAVSESYPDLKANENFMNLQAQLEGTENRINEARNKYNAVVQDYNVLIRSFPKNLLAGMFGFDKMTKFEAEAGAQKAPEIKF
ncbi:MAG: LemA family protein [Prevotella sp.]|jgi:LemA protein|nr:LemA family protein [Prevotella sp.]